MPKGASLIVIILILITSISSTDPTDSNLLLVNGMGISVSLYDETQKDIFKSAEYSNEYEVVLLETKRSMDYIQLINKKGKLEKQIDVRSKNVEIEKSNFTKGKYLMGLKINGQSQIEFVNVVVEK